VLVRDTLISLLASKTQDDLATVRGRDALKGEIRDAVNGILRNDDVKRVYFTQFVIQ
jgi:flagellar FliL protein